MTRKRYPHIGRAVAGREVRLERHLLLISGGWLLSTPDFPFMRRPHESKRDAIMATFGIQLEARE